MIMSNKHQMGQAGSANQGGTQQQAEQRTEAKQGSAQAQADTQNQARSVPARQSRDNAMEPKAPPMTRFGGDPFSLVQRLSEEMDQVFEFFFNVSPFHQRGSLWGRA